MGKAHPYRAGDQHGLAAEFINVENGGDGREEHEDTTNATGKE